MFVSEPDEGATVSVSLMVERTGGTTGVVEISWTITSNNGVCVFTQPALHDQVLVDPPPCLLHFTVHLCGLLYIQEMIHLWTLYQCLVPCSTLALFDSRPSLYPSIQTTSLNWPRYNRVCGSECSVDIEITFSCRDLQLLCRRQQVEPELAISQLLL